MTVYRLTTIAGLVKYWDFFRTGIDETARFLRYDLSMDTYRQMLQFMVKQPSSWIGLCMDDETLLPVGFAIAHECTPIFSQRREYEVSMAYAVNTNPEVLEKLQDVFEEFCQAHGVKCYFATTRRDSGATIRCFQSPKYGFKRAYTVFKKDIT